MEHEVKAGKPRVLGVHGQFSGLLDVEISLEPSPDRYWRDIFNRGPCGVSFSISMHPPQVHVGTVKITPPDGELEKYLEHVHVRIEGTNRQYAKTIAPKLRAAKEGQEREEAESARRVEDAERRIAETQKRLDDAA